MNTVRERPKAPLGRLYLSLLLTLSGGVAPVPTHAGLPGDGFDLETGFWIPGVGWERASGPLGDHWVFGSHQPSAAPAQYELISSVAVNLAGAVEPVLTFSHRYLLHLGLESAIVEVTTAGSPTWTRLASFSGTSWPELPSQRDLSRVAVPAFENLSAAGLGWKSEQIDLSDWTESGDLLLRFRIISLASDSIGQWSIANCAISDSPRPVVLAPISSVTRSRVELNWSPPFLPRQIFGAYRIYRRSGTSKRARELLVAEIHDPLATAYVDSPVVPGRTYTYRVSAVNTFGAEGDGNPRSTATLPDQECFFDDVESGANGWIAECTWDRSDEEASTWTWTDSPGSLYGPSQDCSLSRTIGLASCPRPYLDFRHRFDFDTDNDFGYVEVSNNGGASWERVFGVTGSTAYYEQERIDLSAYAGQVVDVRFRLDTNGSDHRDGWHIDDIGVYSNAAQSPFPLLDDMENAATEANWLPAAWEWVLGESNSPFHSWTDSPDGDQFDETRNRLTLTGTLDLSDPTTVTNPHVSFYHHSITIDDAALQVSPDGGSTWSQLEDLGSAGSWARRQVDLQPYVGSSEVLLRFEAFRDVGSHDGIWLDDVCIANAPQPLTIWASSVSDHEVEVCWSSSNAADFVAYELYRSTSSQTPGALVETVTSQGQTCHTDSSLEDVMRTYYYRIRVRDSDCWDTGLVSQFSNVLPVTTTCSAEAVTVPFFDDMETPSQAWCADVPWAITEEAASSGTSSWSDSPGGLYASSSPNGHPSLYLKLAPITVEKPYLSFRHRFDLETDEDFGYVEVSDDSAQSWVRLFGVTHSTGQFGEVHIDLTEFEGTAPWIRWVLDTDSSVNQDGWFIDDVTVDSSVSQCPFPLADDMEGPDTSMAWFSAGWQLVEGDANSPSTSWVDSPYGESFMDTLNRLTSACTFDLSGALNPQIRFHSRAAADDAWLEISTDGGKTWVEQLADFDSPASWTARQVDLSPYLSSDFRLRFEAFRDAGSFDGAWVDDVCVADAPYPVALSVQSASEHEVELCWSQSQAVDFYRYEVHRSSSANSLGTLIAEITDPAETCFTDTGLEELFTKHHYRVLVRDTDCWGTGLVSQPSNTVSVTTQCGAIEATLPFADDLEGAPTAWCADFPWAITDETAASGVSSWSDSPGGPYASNTSASLYLRLGPVTLQRPLLSFHHVYDFETDEDFGFVEVSADDRQTWVRLFGTTGSNIGFDEVKIDLSEYAGRTLWVRFLVDTDTSGNHGGWHIDDVRLESNLFQVSFPFCDDMESADTASNWLPAGWMLVEGSSSSRTHSWTDSPFGEMYLDTRNRLTLAGTVDLSATSSPEIRFHHKAVDVEDAVVQISTDGGVGWQTLASFDSPSTHDWTETSQLDLTPYRSSNVALRFEAFTNDLSGRDGLWIDDIEIVEDGVGCSPPGGEPAGAVPDGASVPGDPLLLTRADPAQGAEGPVYIDISLSWGLSCSVDPDYSIYEGPLGSWGDHTPRACSTGGETTAELTPSSGDRFYLVVPRSNTREGSYGTTSAGFERPPCSNACLPQLVGGCE